MATESLDSELEDLARELEAFEEDDLFEDSFEDDEIEGMEDLDAKAPGDRTGGSSVKDSLQYSINSSALSFAEKSGSIWYLSIYRNSFILLQTLN